MLFFVHMPKCGGSSLRQSLSEAYGDRLLLGHDNSVTLAIAPRSRIVERSKKNPDQYLFITRKVLPLLRELGATEDHVGALMTANPRRYFAGEA